MIGITHSAASCIFLSYRRDEASLPAVHALHAALEAEGVAVWRDEGQIAPFGGIADA
jgi:hypothetical protein